jgi:hypothetical protein
VSAVVDGVGPPCGRHTGTLRHHLHSNVPNTSGRTRFSIDFHTVDVADIRVGLDFMSAADLSPVPDDVVALFDSGHTDAWVGPTT